MRLCPRCLLIQSPYLRSSFFFVLFVAIVLVATTAFTCEGYRKDKSDDYALRIIEIVIFCVLTIATFLAYVLFLWIDKTSVNKRKTRPFVPAFSPRPIQMTSF